MSFEEHLGVASSEEPNTTNLTKSNSSSSLPECICACKTGSQKHLHEDSRYNTFEKRLETFPNYWPQDQSKDFAEQGFYFTVTGIRCYSCGIRFRHWRPQHDPLLVHIQMSPECQFLQSKYGYHVIVAFQMLKNTPKKDPLLGFTWKRYTVTRGEVLEKGKQLLYEGNRLQTYKNYSFGGDEKSSLALARGGFGYLGPNGVSICCFCGGKIRQLFFKDDEHKEHQAISPKCPMVTGVACNNKPFRF